MGKTEKIGGIAEEAVEAVVASSRGSRVGRWLWKNAFPTFCGLIVVGAAGWVTDLSGSVAENSKTGINTLLEMDYKFRRTEDALKVMAAEVVSLRKLLTRQQVEMGITAYKVGWMHPTRSGKEPAAGDPRPIPFNPEKLIAELEKRLAARAKVDPDDVRRILEQRGRLFEQRQAPNMPPAGNR